MGVFVDAGGVDVRVAVLGLGYVGSVCAACLARMGHQVVGVDVNPDKVEGTNSGQSPIVEPPMPDLVASVVRSGHLRATQSVAEACSDADVSLICVGTPSQQNGDVDLSYLDRVCAEIGAALAPSRKYHVVVVRSTVPPGTIEGRVAPALAAASGRVIGPEIGLCVNPEFLREGSVVDDFLHPAFTLIGETDPRAGAVVASLYRDLDCPTYRTTPAAAQMVKYASNAFHALKISFANEIGRLCQEVGIDGREVMDVFCADGRLNTSRAYLRPGYAYGGSCLPKDLRAIVSLSRHRDVELPVIEAIAPSNERQARRGVEFVVATNRRRVGVIGLSFKAGTDDLRESPIVYLVETLLGKGYDLRIFDPNVSLSRLVGANRQYIERTVPHLSRLLRPTLDEVLAESDVLVIGHRLEGIAAALGRYPGQHAIVDLVGSTGEVATLGNSYHGIAW